MSGRVGTATVKGIGEMPVRVSIECPSGEHALGRMCTCPQEVMCDDRDTDDAVGGR